ncbi:hypothetical protein [Pyxidicoccus xibeiensis]|uniref:hypothetical protein n=1 Tax=Pyxidicoccus xibeiensis TaxID=2906759 RepID=UPI0020A73672|nr:hypothetical protein [Pyxidicoccus xibeiensis]MCP3136461.1 hypothetical protein [Pyxidicoccus xibeiensis]
MRSRVWVVSLLCLLACAGGPEAVREERSGEEASTFVEGDDSLHGAFLPEHWEHLVWGAGADPLEGAVATRPPRRGGGARPVRQAPLLAPARPTPMQSQLRAQRAANQAVVLQARQTYYQRLKEAQAKYPNSAGYENHHFIPMYLGGTKNGQTYRLPTAYHKAVTQAFRREMEYGQAERPSPERLQKILVRVYSQYPIPQLIGITP